MWLDVALSLTACMWLSIVHGRTNFSSTQLCCSSVCIIDRMDRPAKLARLEAFRRSKPGCSASAMSAILQDIAKNGLPPLMQRAVFREARDDVMKKMTPFGPILQHITVLDKSDNPVEVPVADPFATLWTFVNETGGNAGFRSFFKQRLLESPPTPDKPWQVILYTDEITPGNVVAPINSRKFHALYWSFAELGSNALSREEFWFVLLIEFSNAVNEFHAGISQVFKQCIKRFFQRDGFNFATSGILLEFPDGDVRLWAVLGGILQDGGAHKYVWHIRGDGASKYCLLCRNLFTEVSNVVEADGTNLLRCNVIKLDELVSMSGKDLRTNARYLAGQHGRLNADRFNELQQSLGLTHHQHALLLDRELDDVFDPCEVYMHDSMHGLYVDGVVNLVVYLLFEAFIGSNMRNVYEVFAGFVSNWKWPARVQDGMLSEMFTELRAKKHRAAMHIKGQASDLLSIMGVLAHFTKTVLMRASEDSNCRNACQAFLALATVCELVSETARSKVEPAELLGKIHCFLELFVAAWGYEWLTPKSHWMLHYPEVLQKMGRLFNCFCLERKHRVPKRYAEGITNISKHASMSILKEVVCHQLASAKKPGAFGFSIGLIGGRPAPKRARAGILHAAGLADEGDEILVAHESRINERETCQKGDVVVLHDGSSFRAGRIAQHLELAGTALSLVHPWTLHRKLEGTSMAIWNTTADAELWATQDIMAAVEHTVFPDGKVGILLPLQCR